jgi:hypothetical protein
VRILMKISQSGTVDGLTLPPAGSETDVPDALGAELCASGIAEPVAAPEPEKATAPRPQRR